MIKASQSGRKSISSSNTSNTKPKRPTITFWGSSSWTHHHDRHGSIVKLDNENPSVATNPAFNTNNNNNIKRIELKKTLSHIAEETSPTHSQILHESPKRHEFNLDEEFNQEKLSIVPSTFEEKDKI